MATERDMVKVTLDGGVSSVEESKREVLVTGGTPAIIPDKVSPTDFSNVEMSPEEIAGRKRMEEFYALPVDKQKARLVTILDRGIVFDRLKVDLPNDLHGEWCRNDPLEIDRMRTLGFWVDTTYATRRRLHSDGSGANIVGDVIHVVTTKENKKMIDRVQLENQERFNKRPKDAPEETTGRSSVPSEIPVFSQSTQRPATVSDVVDALKTTEQQTAVKR